MIVFGIICILLAIVLCFLSVYSNFSVEILLEGLFAGILLLIGICVIVSELTYEEQTEFKYPLNEYKLEYEVLSKGEQVDSTYVITKIE